MRRGFVSAFLALILALAILSHANAASFMSHAHHPNPALDDYVESVLFDISRLPRASSREVEFFTIVYVNQDGTFGHMPFTELTQSGGQAMAAIPINTTPAAIAHNHTDRPNGSMPGALSPLDIAAADQLGVPIYALSQAGPWYGETVKYVPGKTRVRKDGTGAERVLALIPCAAVVKS